MEESIRENEGENQSLREEIYETIIKLNQERLNLEQDSRFIEAGKVKAKLKLLGDEFIKVSLSELRERQLQEKHEFEERYEKELQEVQITFDENIQEKERQIQEKLTELQEMHGTTLRDLHSQLKSLSGNENRTTPEIINIEYQIKKLVSNQRYNEAGLLQKKLEVLKEKAREKNYFRNEDKTKNKMEKIIRDQMIELSAIESKLISERDSMIKAREKAIEAIHCKYRVFHDKMVKVHQSDAVNEERALKNFNPCSNYLIHGR